MNIREKISKLIEYSGGKVLNNRYVIESGVVLISKTENVIPKEIANLLNLTEYNKQLAELNARITYMNFQKPRENYIEGIINNQKHYSILSNITLGFLVVGVKGETLLEFASSIANISRQTTSRTKSADDTLYNVSKVDIPFVEKYLKIRDSYLEIYPQANNKNEIEKRNEFNLFTKSMCFTISMPLSDWIHYIDKKLLQDYEYELKNICHKIKELIKKEYPYIEFASDKEDIKQMLYKNK